MGSAMLLQDQLGRTVSLPMHPPQRIVSLVPSQTELLHALGLDEEVVGITKFCIHPKHWHKEKARIGGTKNAKIERILALKPDLILANKEENEKGTLEILSQFCPVWISDVRSVAAAVEMIALVGHLVGKSEKAAEIAAGIEQDFAKLSPRLQNRKVLYAIWREPWMFAGPDTFIGDVIKRLGGINMAAQVKESRYPSIEAADLVSFRPDLILLSSEPFPFKDKHIAELKAILPSVEVQIVDGAYFSWYGSRLLNSVPYFDAIFAHE